MRASLLAYWPAAVVIFAGAAFTSWLGLRSESWTVVGWSGATVGLLAGIAIGAIQRRQEAGRARRWARTSARLPE